VGLYADLNFVVVISLVSMPKRPSALLSKARMIAPSSFGITFLLRPMAWVGNHKSHRTMLAPDQLVAVARVF